MKKHVIPVFLEMLLTEIKDKATKPLPNSVTQFDHYILIKDLEEIFNKFQEEFKK